MAVESLAMNGYFRERDSNFRREIAAKSLGITSSADGSFED